MNVELRGGLMAAMSLVSLLLISLISECHSDLHWTYNIFSDPSGNYRLSWLPDNDSVTFEVQAATKGLLGLGFSKTGQLSRSDAVIGWVNAHGKSTILDCHFNMNGEFLVDYSQDYELLDGYEDSNHTTMRFRRKFDTCDNNDIIISDDTVYVMYAWLPYDPNSTKTEVPGGIIWNYEPKLLLSKTPKPVEITENVLKWDVTFPNITIPSNTTTYMCMISDTLQLHEQYQVIGFDMLISPESEGIVHHMLFFQCLGPIALLTEMYRGVLFPCYEDGKLPVQLLCKTPIAAWAVGSKQKSFPPDVGISVGGSSKFLISVHFNNVQKKEGIRDSSGIRLYLSKAIRPKEASFLHISSKLQGTSMVLPPHQPNFTAAVHCPTECTQEGLPIDGIHVIGVGFHAHSTARRVRIRHVRGNIELPYIAVDNNFQYGFQEMKYLKESVHILPGDHIISECDYDLSSRNTTTLGGKNTEDEMCLHYLFYYPRSKLNFVYSGPRAEENYEFFHIKHPYLQTIFSGKSPNDLIKEFNWDGIGRTEESNLQKIQMNDIYSGYCLGYDGKGTLLKHFTSKAPQVEIPYVPLTQLSCNTAREK